MDTLSKIFEWENARVLLLVLLLGGVSAEAVYSIKSPAIPLLPPYLDGTWIRPNWPANLVAMYGDTEIAAFYRKRIMVTEPSRIISVDLTAYRNVTLFLDRNPLPLPVPSSWKDRIHYVLPAHLLTSGSHELMLRVANRMGPPLFHVSSNVGGLGDLEGWEFSQDGMIWIPALRCDDMMMVEIRSMFPTVGEGLRSSLRFLVPVLAGVLALAAFRPRCIVRFAAPGSIRIIFLVLIVQCEIEGGERELAPIINASASQLGIVHFLNDFRGNFLGRIAVVGCKGVEHLLVPNPVLQHL